MPKSSIIYKEDRSFEAILQLRPRNEEVLKYVENLVKKREKVFITKFLEKKFGYDLYLNNQKYAKAIGAKLRKAFKGNVKVTRTLYGRDRHKGKLIYRLTVCFRLKEKELV